MQRYECPNCHRELTYIGYEEKSGVDITPDGNINLDSVGDGEVWDNRYFCPDCECTLVVGTDIFID